MYHILNQVDNPKDLKRLNITEKHELAKEIRDLLIKTVSETGGHLASNLGVVELTIALHSILNTPYDKIIWDVGHQTYVHKILTERKGKIRTLRKLNGIAGFPKSTESEYDSFDTGHSSTSISVAAGMARARDIKGEKNNIVAVIGDGALTGGMAFEALNDIGFTKTNLIVILNDNEMSISKNVGRLSELLTKVRTRKSYNKSNNYIKRNMLKVPYVGKKVVKLIRKIKYSIKQLFLSNMFFEDLGFKYLGPVDGHNIEKLEDIIFKAKNLSGPILIHVVTKKGKGYLPAESMPDKFHATGPFDIETGESKGKKQEDYSKVFGDALLEIAENNPKVVAITAAMKDGTGLTKFAEKYPNRFLDVGIAEQHALAMAAGMAKEELIPVIPLYSSFYQRGYDQVIHDVAMQNLPVIMCVDRAGCVGADGETHQGTLDMAFFRLVPNLTIMAPKDFKELEDMLEFAVKLNKPVIIRYPRGGEDSKVKFERHENIELGKAEVLKKIIDEEKSNKTKILQKIGDKVFNNKTQRERVTIIAIGKMVARAMDIGQRLQEKMDVEVINARFLKPLDDNTIIESIKKTKNVITIEDGTIINGLATAVKEVIVNNNLQGVKIKSYAYPDEFIKHGSVDELEKIYGLDEENIINGVNKS